MYDHDPSRTSMLLSSHFTAMGVSAPLRQIPLPTLHKLQQVSSKSILRYKITSHPPTACTVTIKDEMIQWIYLREMVRDKHINQSKTLE